MNVQKLIAVFCFVFSCNAFADKTSPILFDQVLGLKPNQLYEIKLENVQPSDQIWTAVYLVGRQNYPGPTSKVDFVIDNQGLLNKSNASEHKVHQQLIAENLKQSSQYSFHQFKKLTSIIDEISVMLIEDPILEKTDTVRIYSQVNDWIPEYNSYEQTKIQFGIEKPVDFDIVAAYVMVGKGEKPAQLSELNFNKAIPSTINDSTAAIPLKQSEAPPVASVESSELGTKSSAFHSSRIEVKMVMFIVVAIITAIFAFINRRKFRRAF